MWHQKANIIFRIIETSRQACNIKSIRHYDKGLQGIFISTNTLRRVLILWYSDYIFTVLYSVSIFYFIFPDLSNGDGAISFISKIRCWKLQMISTYAIRKIAKKQLSKMFFYVLKPSSNQSVKQSSGDCLRYPFTFFIPLLWPSPLLNNFTKERLNSDPAQVQDLLVVCRRFLMIWTSAMVPVWNKA